MVSTSLTASESCRNRRRPPDDFYTPSVMTSELAVRRLRSVLLVVSMLAAQTVWAQTFPPNEAGVTMGHWHLNTSDVEANKKILVAMGIGQVMFQAV